VVVVETEIMVTVHGVRLKSHNFSESKFLRLQVDCRKGVTSLVSPLQDRASSISWTDQVSPFFKCHLKKKQLQTLKCEIVNLKTQKYKICQIMIIYTCYFLLRVGLSDYLVTPVAMTKRLQLPPLPAIHHATSVIYLITLMVLHLVKKKSPVLCSLLLSLKY